MEPRTLMLLLLLGHMVCATPGSVDDIVNGVNSKMLRLELFRSRAHIDSQVSHGSVAGQQNKFNVVPTHGIANSNTYQFNYVKLADETYAKNNNNNGDEELAMSLDDYEELIRTGADVQFSDDDSRLELVLRDKNGLNSKPIDYKLKQLPKTSKPTIKTTTTRKVNLGRFGGPKLHMKLLPIFPSLSYSKNVNNRRPLAPISLIKNNGILKNGVFTKLQQLTSDTNINLVNVHTLQESSANSLAKNGAIHYHGYSNLTAFKGLVGALIGNSFTVKNFKKFNHLFEKIKANFSPSRKPIPLQTVRPSYGSKLACYNSACGQANVISHPNDRRFKMLPLDNNGVSTNPSPNNMKWYSSSQMEQQRGYSNSPFLRPITSHSVNGFFVHNFNKPAGNASSVHYQYDPTNNQAAAVQQLGPEFKQSQSSIQASGKETHYPQQPSRIIALGIALQANVNGSASGTKGISRLVYSAGNVTMSSFIPTTPPGTQPTSSLLNQQPMFDKLIVMALSQTEPSDGVTTTSPIVPVTQNKSNNLYGTERQFAENFAISKHEKEAQQKQFASTDSRTKEMSVAKIEGPLVYEEKLNEESLNKSGGMKYSNDKSAGNDHSINVTEQLNDVEPLPNVKSDDDDVRSVHVVVGKSFAFQPTLDGKFKKETEKHTASHEESSARAPVEEPLEGAVAANEMLSNSAEQEDDKEVVVDEAETSNKIADAKEEAEKGEEDNEAEEVDEGEEANDGEEITMPAKRAVASKALSPVSMSGQVSSLTTTTQATTLIRNSEDLQTSHSDHQFWPKEARYSS